MCGSEVILNWAHKSEALEEGNLLVTTDDVMDETLTHIRERVAATEASPALTSPEAPSNL